MKNAIWLFILTIFVVAYFLPSYQQMQDLKKTNIEYRQKIEDLQEEKRQLIAEKHKLDEDPLYLERVAREKMGLVKEGEVVYKLVPVSTTKEGNLD